MRKHAAIAAIACCVVLASYEFAVAAKGSMLLGDFRAFYCAGSATAHGTDPYFAASLYSCERAPAPAAFYQAPAGVAVPAPLPAYALIPFAVLSFLPYAAAGTLWLAIVTAAAVAAVVLTSRAIGRSIEAVVPAFAIGFAAVVMPYGQLASLEICALVGLAFALRSRRWNAAALAAAACAIVPHVALPALAAVFLIFREMRIRLVIAAAALGALDVLAAGPQSAYAYFASVLPAHALSEIGRTSQYGLTWVAHALGASDRSAILYGEISYVFMSIAGIVAAARLVRTRSDAAPAALVPPAFAMLGGTFVHYTEIMVAIPAALLLAAGASKSAKLPLFLGCMLIAVPWALCVNQPLLVVTFCVAGIALAKSIGSISTRGALQAGMACAGIACVILFVAAHAGDGITGAASSERIVPALAQASWESYVRLHWSGTSAIWWIAKAPTWLGLSLLALGGAYALAKKYFVFGVAIEHAPVVT